MSTGERRLPVILALGTTQTLAWASSYYLPALTADPIARDLGITTTSIFAAFSVSLLISAVLGPRVGRTIDLIGGRGVLMLSNVLFAAGLVAMAVSHGVVTMWLAWMLMGAGMGLGLYDAAFAALTRIYGMNARVPITGITLMAGFACTVGWPLTAWGIEAIGWRSTCLGWAAAHLLLGLPVNRFLLPRPSDAGAVRIEGTKHPHIPLDRNMVLLAIAFAFGWVISTAMAAHLPRILEAVGATPVEAIATAALVGPAQVAARLAEASLLQRQHPLLSARLSAALHPIGVAAVAVAGPLAIAPFTVLHGAGNGILTIARGTVPLAIYGPENYGLRLGILGAPARVAQAAAPLAFGLMIDRWGLAVLAVSAAMGLLTLAAFVLVEPEALPPETPKAP